MAHTDHRQIEYLLYEYARRVDAGDFTGVGAMFEHGTFGTGEARLGGREVADVLRGAVILYDDGTPRTRHVTTNVAIEVDGDDATAVSYFTVLQSMPEGTIQTIVAGHYEDAFERGGDGWRFTSRIVHSNLVGDISAHLTINPFV